MHRHWSALPTLLALAREGSLSAAARKLGVAHTTVARRVEALEAHLDTRLVERTPSAYALTPAGEEVVALAEQAEAVVLALERAAAGRDQEPAGRVRLTAAEAALPLILPSVRAMRRDWPRVEVELTLSDRMLDLDRREADIALRPSADPPEEAVGRRVAEVAWCAYGPADEEVSAWAGYGPPLDGLAASRWLVDQGVEPSLWVSSVPAMRRVVSGVGCQGLLPCFAGDLDARLVRTGEPIPQAATPLWLLVHADLRRAARVRVVVDRLWEDLRAQVPLIEGSGAPADCSS